MAAIQQNYVIEKRALSKMMLHALKYPHATVTGVFLARKSVKSAGDDQHISEVVHIADAIPFSHLNHGLTPMLEVALLQTSVYASNLDLEIVSFYQANANFHDVEPDVFAQKVGEKLIESNEHAFITMLQEESLAKFLSTEEVDEILVPFSFIDGKWKNSKNVHLQTPKEHFKAIREMVFEQQLHKKLIDFDQHLEDIRSNWFNTHLHFEIDQCGDNSSGCN